MILLADREGLDQIVDVQANLGLGCPHMLEYTFFSWHGPYENSSYFKIFQTFFFYIFIITHNFEKGDEAHYFSLICLLIISFVTLHLVYKVSQKVSKLRFWYFKDFKLLYLP